MTSFLDDGCDVSGRPSTSSAATAMTTMMMSRRLALGHTASVGCRLRRGRTTRHGGSPFTSASASPSVSWTSSSSSLSSLNSSTASSDGGTPSLSAAERVEMRRLGGLLPRRLIRQHHRRRVAIRTAAIADDALSTVDGMDALDVVRCAAKYIAQLTATVVARVNNGSLPKEALEQIPPHFYRRRSSASTAAAAVTEPPNTIAASSTTTRLLLRRRQRRRRQQQQQQQQPQSLGAPFRKRGRDVARGSGGDDALPKRLRYL